jgi:hypothetical protein
MIASYNWESDTFTHHTTTPAQVTFREAVLQVADKAKAVLPDNASRIDKAIGLVLNGHVEIVDGHCRVMSQSNGKTVYHQVNGTCTCLDFTQDRAPGGYCKHRLAHGLYRRAMELVQVQEPTSPVEASGTTTAHIPQEFLTTIHNKQFVQYAGLLAMAHDRGLVNLSAHFISVTDTLALAEATAEFADGKVFMECADATPGNVGPTVRAHYPRIALTRAKARCLRDALNISVCSVEELET